GDLRGNGENRYAVTVAVVQPVDQVQVTRAAAAGADSETPGEVRLGARGEGRSLLVSRVDPSKLVLSPDGIGDPVERVSRDPVDPRDLPANEGIYKQFRDRLLPHGVRSCLRPTIVGVFLAPFRARVSVRISLLG